MKCDEVVEAGEKGADLALLCIANWIWNERFFNLVFVDLFWKGNMKSSLV